MTQLLGIASLTFAVSTCVALVYALILRGKHDELKDRLWFTTQASMQRAAQIVEDAEMLKANREQIAGLKKQLADALLRVGETYELLAKAGVGGAGARLDDLMFPDADAEAVAAGRGAGPVPDRSTTAPTGAEADLVSGERVARREPGDLL